MSEMSDAGERAREIVDINRHSWEGMVQAIAAALTALSQEGCPRFAHPEYQNKIAALETANAELRASIRHRTDAEPEWRVGYRSIEGGVVTVVEGVINKGDYDALKAEVERLRAGQSDREKAIRQALAPAAIWEVNGVEQVLHTIDGDGLNEMDVRRILYNVLKALATPPGA